MPRGVYKQFRRFLFNRAAQIGSVEVLEGIDSITRQYN